MGGEWRDLYALLPVLVFTVVAVGAQEVTECGDNNQLKLKNVVIQPYPVQLPGTQSVSLEAELLKSIDNISAEITVKKKFFLFWVDVKSWSFDDICGKLEKQYGTTGCPVVAGTEGIQCMCPFQPGTVTIKDFEYTITDADLPGGITGLFLDGEYKVEVKVSSNGVEVGCSEIDLEIAKVT